MSALRASFRIVASLIIVGSLMLSQISASEAESGDVAAWQQELLPDDTRRSRETLPWILALLPSVFLLPPECWTEVLCECGLESLANSKEDTLSPWESLDYCFAEGDRSFFQKPRLLTVQRFSRTIDETRLVDAVLRFELVALPQLSLCRGASFDVLDDSISLRTTTEAQNPAVVLDDYEPTIDILPSLEGWKTSTAILAIVLFFLGVYVMLAWMAKG